MQRKPGKNNEFTRPRRNTRVDHSSSLIGQKKGSLLGESILEGEASAVEEVKSSSKKKREQPKIRQRSSKANLEAGIFKESTSTRLTEDDLRKIRSQPILEEEDDEHLKFTLEGEDDDKSQSKKGQSGGLFKQMESLNLKDKHMKMKEQHGKSKKNSLQPLGEDEVSSFNETDELPRSKGPK